jgi:hypothetical protein
MATERKIGDLLRALAEDGVLMDKYREHERQFLEEFGLPPDKQDIVLSGDLNRIRQAVQEEYPDAEVFFIHFGIIQFTTSAG